MATWFITYTEKLARTGKALVLVRSDGNSDVLLDQDPLGLPFEGRSEIGHFRFQLNDTNVGALRAAIERAIPEAPDEPPKIMPGTRTIAFGLGFDDAVDDLVSFPLRGELPPATARFREELLKSAGEIVQHPYKTIKAKANWLTTSLTTDENALALELRLINSGIVPITIPNPAEAPDDDAVGLTLLLRRDLPLDKPTSRDAGALQILKREVKAITEDNGDDEDEEEPSPMLTLHPDQEYILNIETRRHLYITPGKYQGSITMNLPADDIPDEETVIGRLSTQTGSFAVRRP